MNLERFNPALLNRRMIGEKIETTGARFIPIGNGIKTTPFEEIIQATLLGRRSSLLNTEKLSLYERQILQSGCPHVLTILDLDGVLVAGPLEFILNPKRESISLSAFRFLKEVVKASDRAFIFTSRFNPDMIRERYPFLRKLLDFFNNNKVISSFPFLDSASITRLEKFGNSFKGKNGEGLTVFVNKPLEKYRRTMLFESEIKDFFNKYPENSICYVIGSSVFDRRSILQLCQGNHELASRIVYIDTGHLLI